MKLGDIFTDALKYPLSDYTKLLIVGVIVLIGSLEAVFAQFDVYNGALYALLSIISVITSVLLMGYGVSVIKETIDYEDIIPDFDWAKNFVDGIKYAIVSIIYYIIPAIIVAVIGFIIGYGPLSAIFTESNINKFAALNGTFTADDILNIVPMDIWNSLFTAFAVTAVIAIILFIIFAVFEYIAVCRLSKYDSLGEAFAIGEIYSDIREIGFLKIIGFLIIAVIISAILGMIFAFVSAIPYVGVFITSLVGYPFILLFNYRALGLLYLDI